MNALEQAEALLVARDLHGSLATYAALEHDCTEPDRLSGGRWMCHMLLGHYEEAWRESDAIRARGNADPHRFWQGEPIDGKRVIVRCLRGYGDTVMYLRWLPQLRLHASEVIVQTCPEMLPMVAAMMPTNDEPAIDRSEARKTGRHTAQCPIRLTAWSNPGQPDYAEWDVQVESAELSYLFRTTLATLPAPVRLFFPTFESERIRTRLGPRTRPRAGLVWTGSSYDPARSILFEELRPLLTGDTVEFWSLQAPGNNDDWNRFCAERGWAARTFYTRETADEEYCDNTVIDMAAFASELDLVITIDTLAAHVAGSLGLPTWLLLKRAADWRWLLGRDDSPWYPTMRLFRQTTEGDWSGPLARVCDALHDFHKEQSA